METPTEIMKIMREIIKEEFGNNPTSQDLIDMQVLIIEDLQEDITEEERARFSVQLAAITMELHKVL